MASSMPSLLAHTGIPAAFQSCADEALRRPRLHACLIHSTNGCIFLSLILSGSAARIMRANAAMTMNAAAAINAARFVVSGGG